MDGPRQCFHNCCNIAPMRLYQFRSLSYSSVVMNASSLLSSSQKCVSWHEPMAICKNRLNSRADARLAQPSTIFAGTERAARRSCRADSTCSSRGNFFVSRDTSNAALYDSWKTSRSRQAVSARCSPYLEPPYFLTSVSTSVRLLRLRRYPQGFARSGCRRRPWPRIFLSPCLARR